MTPVERRLLRDLDQMSKVIRQICRNHTHPTQISIFVGTFSDTTHKLTPPPSLKTNLKTTR